MGVGPLYDQTEGQEGFVSIEVSPKLAFDMAASVAEARRFWTTSNRPNIMVKIPATDQGRVDDASRTIAHLYAAGIRKKVETDRLRADGVRSFTDAPDKLDAAIHRKREMLLAGYA